MGARRTAVEAAQGHAQRQRAVQDDGEAVADACNCEQLVLAVLPEPKGCAQPGVGLAVDVLSSCWGEVAATLTRSCWPTPRSFVGFHHHEAAVRVDVCWLVLPGQRSGSCSEGTPVDWAGALPTTAEPRP